MPDTHGSDHVDSSDEPVLVPECAVTGCRRSARQSMTHVLVNGRTVSEHVCDRCATLYRARPGSRAEFAPLISDETSLTSLAAEDVMPGVLTWNVPPEDTWGWTLASTTTVLDHDGRLLVRWTYQDGRTRTFPLGQRVHGHYRPGETTPPGTRRAY